MLKREIKKLNWNRYICPQDRDIASEGTKIFSFLNKPTFDEIYFYENNNLLADYAPLLCKNTTSNFLSSIIYFYLTRERPSLFDVAESECYPPIELKKGIIVKKELSDETALFDYDNELVLTKSAVGNHIGLSFTGIIFNISKNYGYNPRLINERVFDEDVLGYKASHRLSTTFGRKDFSNRAKIAHDKILIDLFYSSLNRKQKMFLYFKRFFIEFNNIFEEFYSFNIPILPILLQAIDDIVLPAHGYDFKIDRSKFQAIKRI